MRTRKRKGTQTLQSFLYLRQELCTFKSFLYKFFFLKINFHPLIFTTRIQFACNFFQFACLWNYLYCNCLLLLVLTWAYRETFYSPSKSLVTAWVQFQWFYWFTFLFSLLIVHDVGEKARRRFSVLYFKCNWNKICINFTKRF